MTEFDSNIKNRRAAGRLSKNIFQGSTLIGIIVLMVLILKIVNGTFGITAIKYAVAPSQLSTTDMPLENLPKEDLAKIFQDYVSEGLYSRFENEQPFSERTQEDIHNLILEWVVDPTIERVWTLYESLFLREEIFNEWEEEFPYTYLFFTNWLDAQFITSPQSSNPIRSGVRTAIFGTLWTIGVAIVFSFPIGVGAAIYLEEYAAENLFSKFIQTNISNLAGVPSIIYGMLGLSIFVRAMGKITSGVAFGYADPTTANGRTLLSAGLTLGLLILPLIIINSQEAIKAVPSTIKQASLGLGATTWQTIWHHVLPNALPGILTGAILSISRAIGETAPLVVVGASTFIKIDPDGIFSKFTTLPIQIYQWTARPQDEFRSIAAAASIVLLIMLLSMNAIAVILRNRYSQKS